ncbi:MAG TPA: DUF5777 family beta-barrel protein [Bacteroidia bacterium]|nr:DUF5777 family beta-barrel protein [Bacteroidia bacterium]
MTFLRKLIPILLTLLFYGITAKAQDDDLLSLIDDDSTTVEHVTSAFKSTRVINSHSIESLSSGVLDFRIMHRFGRINTGAYQLYGLDQATIRLGFDYGITDRFTVGFGRGTYYKELDGFLKYKLLWQSTGAKTIPVSLVLVSGMTVNGLKWADETRKNYFSSRLGYYYQILIGRKFSDVFTLQLGPTMVHRNLVATKEEHHDIYALEAGTRIRLSRRIALTADYFYIPPNQLDSRYGDVFSVGFDIETGGHVFQLHFTNATAMNEKTFITENDGKWSKGDIHFGFNISRVFTLSSKKRKMK